MVDCQFIIFTLLLVGPVAVFSLLDLSSLLDLDLSSSLGNEDNGQSGNEFEGRGVCPNIAPIKFFLSAESQAISAAGSLTFSGFSFQQKTHGLCQIVGLRRYRTYDGTCNHPLNLGRAMTPMGRLLPPAYDDRVDSPRQTGVSGHRLPSARDVSRVAHPPHLQFNNLTIMLMQWGQWLDHDMTMVSVASEPNGSITCCGPDNGNPPFYTHKECFPIEITSGEGHFPGTCMEFVRSVAATDSCGNDLKPRQQVNSLTSFIDASQVYGSSKETVEEIREADHYGGLGYLLKTKNGNFLPEGGDDCIKRPGTSDYCFKAGDMRVNEQPGLSALHTVFLREHNRIAAQLRQLSDFNVGDEEIFQATRKIIGAINQVITYNEWLPIIIGEEEAEHLGLLSRTGRSFYKPHLDPRIINSFAAVAFRFGHSNIPDGLPIGDRFVPFKELFMRPAEVLDNFDDLVAGLAGVGLDQQAPIVEQFVSQQMTNHLFEPPSPDQGKGLDLVALDIQRARDHGIAAYNKWRAYCGLRPAYGFDDTEVLGPYSYWLESVYSSVNDIDLFTGMLYEPPVHGLVGPLLSCLLGIQFFNTKYGDSFFFDTKNPVTGFSDVQVQELRNVTLSKILCQVTDIAALPLNVFKFTSQDNPLVPCSQQRSEGLDLTIFANTGTYNEPVDETGLEFALQVGLLGPNHKK